MKTRSIFTENSNYLKHHGVQGQKWGIRNGPPYPLNHEASRTLGERIHRDFGEDAPLTKMYRDVQQKYASVPSQRSKMFDANGRVEAYRDNDGNWHTAKLDSEIIDQYAANSYLNREASITLSKKMSKMDSNSESYKRLNETQKSLEASAKISLDHVREQAKTSAEVFGKGVTRTFGSYKYDSKNKAIEFSESVGHYKIASAVGGAAGAAGATATLVGLEYLSAVTTGYIRINPYMVLVPVTGAQAGAKGARVLNSKLVAKSYANKVAKSDPSAVGYYSPEYTRNQTR